MISNWRPRRIDERCYASRNNNVKIIVHFYRRYRKKYVVCCSAFQIQIAIDRCRNVEGDNQFKVTRKFRNFSLTDIKSR